MTGTRLGSVMDAFRNFTSGSTVPPQPPAQPNPQQIPATVTENKTVPNGDPGTTGAVTTAIATEGEKSPLDGFKDLWHTDPKAKPAAKLTPDFAIDPAKIMETVKGQDFTAHLDKATLAKAAAGNDSEALAAIINQSVQAGVALATTASMKNLEQVLQAQNDKFFKEVLPQELRKHSISSTVRADNPAYSDPALQPLVKALEQQLAVKHPTATPDQITAFTKDYLHGASKSILAGSGMQITEVSKEGEGTQQGAPEDWAKYFGV